MQIIYDSLKQQIQKIVSNDDSSDQSYGVRCTIFFHFSL